MLSSQITYRLANLISIYISNEMVIEMIRKDLSNIPSFDSLIAFQRIDQQNIGFISARQINYFLLENKIPSIISDCELLIKFFDMDNDGMLSFEEFCSIILPATINYKEKAPIRKVLNSLPSRKIQSVIEKTLARLLEAEFRAQIQIENAKKYLSNKFDFNASHCFQALDVFNHNYLNADAIKCFMKRVGSPKTNTEIYAFIRRVDKDNDARLSFSEFYDSISPLRNIRPHKRSRSFCSKCNLLCENYPDSEYFESDPTETPNSYAKKQSLSPQRIIQTDFNPDISPEKVTYISPNIENDVPIRKFRYNVERDIGDYDIGIIKAILEINKFDQELHDEIATLVDEPDFDIVTFFKIFDKGDKGFIFFEDLKIGFHEFDLAPTTEEQVLFFKKCDIDGDNKISFNDFCEAFLLKDTNHEFLNEVSNVSALDFTIYTRGAIKSVLTSFIDNELQIESIKRNLFCQYYLNANEAFANCDRNGTGYLTFNDVRDLLNSYPFMNYDIDLIFNRFDKDIDGRISIEEFTEEISPHKIITVPR